MKKSIFLLVVITTLFLTSCGTDNIVNSEYSNYDGRYLMLGWGKPYFTIAEHEDVQFRNTYIKIGKYVFDGTWSDIITHDGDSLKRQFISRYDGPTNYSNEALVLQIKFYFPNPKITGSFHMTIRDMVDEEDVISYDVSAHEVKQ
ncbi:MAG: hypothetical protein M9949_04775 [Candidatus Kapabacteria bacterium]|nr:hypothetical protein [Candidatus Kapabacteria bacterium]